MRGQRHAPAAFYPRERPGTHFTGGQVGRRAGLDGGKSRPTGFQSSDRPASSRSLYRLRYPAPLLSIAYLIQLHVGGEKKRNRSGITYSTGSNEVQQKNNFRRGLVFICHNILHCSIRRWQLQYQIYDLHIYIESDLTFTVAAFWLESFNMHLDITSGRWPTWRTILLCNTFISILYMFRANTC